MTREEAITKYIVPAIEKTWNDKRCKEILEALKQEPCDDAISRQAVLDLMRSLTRWCVRSEDGKFNNVGLLYDDVMFGIDKLPPVTPKPKTGQYEKHIDHTDCIWYGNDSGCPVTCSQYRDGWNDAMDYIFKNGKGYQPYKHDA